MKKIITSLAAFLVLGVSISLANDLSPVPERINRALAIDFEKPSNIEWKTTDAFYKASFTSGSDALEAFYNQDGVLIATSRNIAVAQLPMNLQKELKSLAPVYHEEELFELLTDRGTEYFVKFHNGKEVKSYRGNTGGWTRL